MILNNLLAIGRSSEERALISLGIGIGGLFLSGCIIKVCLIWERRRRNAITDYLYNYSHYGTTNLPNRVQNFRRNSQSMPPATLPETSFFRNVPLSPSSMDESDLV